MTRKTGGRGEGGGEGVEEEEKTTHIKSNNPHLTGGEHPDPLGFGPGGTMHAEQKETCGDSFIGQRKARRTLEGRIKRVAP